MHPASEDPQTATALAAHQAGGLRWLAGGLIAIVLAVLMAAAAVSYVDSGGGRLPLVGVVVPALVLGGGCAVVAGAGALLRTRRWREALVGAAWTTGRLRVAGAAVLVFEPDGYDELDPSDQPVRLRLLSTAVWRTRAVQQLAGAEIRAAPVGSGQWVFTADGAGTVYGARAVSEGR